MSVNKTAETETNNTLDSQINNASSQMYKRGFQIKASNWVVNAKQCFAVILISLCSAVRDPIEKIPKINKCTALYIWKSKEWKIALVLRLSSFLV